MARFAWMTLGGWILCTFSLTAQFHYIPHVTRADGHFETAFWLVNTHSVAQEFALTAFDASETVVGEVTKSLAAGETRRETMASLFQSSMVAWLRYQAGSGLEVTVVYRAKGTDKVSASTHGNDDLAHRWRIYAGDPRLVWDGVALVNVHQESSSFIYEAFDETGHSLGTISPFAPLMPLSKDLHVLSDSFPAAAYYEVSSQLPLAVVSLRGDLGSSNRLWVNPALGLDGRNTEIAHYEVFIQATWSKETHPQAYEGIPDPHFSHIGGATHRDTFQLWQSGELSSPGMVDMAETGGISLLGNEVMAAMGENLADQFIEIREHTAAPGSRSFTVQVQREFAFISVVSMIAPTPDWFVGVSGLGLRDEKGWIEEIRVDLRPYDSGTRQNNTFQLFGPQTLPPAPIQAITGEPLGSSPLGEMVIRRIRQP